MSSSRATFGCVPAALILTLCAQLQLPAQVKGTSKKVSVPFIGCGSYGQVETPEAPKGISKAVPITPKEAQSLAYYQSAVGIGLLAPRGWYCEGSSGSSGEALFLSPNPIDRVIAEANALEGPAIEIYHMNSGASGRYGIAELMARVFPAYRAFAMRVLKELDMPLPAGPFPKDTLMYRGPKVVEYTTPAQTEGLGNFHSRLGKSDLPIRGAAIIIGDPPNAHDGPDIVLLSVRLPPALIEVLPIIVGQFERDTVGHRRN